MAVPTLLQTYPVDADVGIPVGESILLTFDRGVDLQTIKNSVVLYGKDFDRTSGPQTAMWLDADTGSNPFFLKSPGFAGIVDTDVELVYVDTTTYADSGITTVLDEASELSQSIGHQVRIRPVSGALAPDVEYTLYINGDPDAISQGVSGRTIFDAFADGGNAATTGSVASRGSYTSGSADIVKVRITTAGDIGTAKYKWWYDSLGEPSAVLGKVTSRRSRMLEDGVQVNFKGSAFAAGDLYTFVVQPYERLATSNRIIFTTNDGSYTAAPDSPSTPATTLPPTSILPTFTTGAGAAAGAAAFTVSQVLPAIGSYEIDPLSRVITVTFTEAPDPATIVDANINLSAYPVLGQYGSSQTKALSKSLELVGAVLTIRF